MLEARWVNVFGEEVDLDDIDRIYALNILTHLLSHPAVRTMSPSAVQNSPLVNKLREVILEGRDPNYYDCMRYVDYKLRCHEEGIRVL